MTERKPAGASWAGFLEAQIKKAQDEGQFDNLPGLGKPIPGLGKRYDAMWWLRDLMKREDLDYTPQTLALRASVEAFSERLPKFRTEFQVRRKVKELNARIAKANATQTHGPGSSLGQLSEDATVQTWRQVSGL